jgi:hypothetical protein
MGDKDDDSSEDDSMNEHVILKPSFRPGGNSKDASDAKPREPFAWEVSRKPARSDGASATPAGGRFSSFGPASGAGSNSGRREAPLRNASGPRGEESGGWTTAGGKVTKRNVPGTTSNSGSGATARWAGDNRSGSKESFEGSEDGGHQNNAFLERRSCVRYTPAEILEHRTVTPSTAWKFVEGITSSEMFPPVCLSEFDKEKWTDMWIAAATKMSNRAANRRANQNNEATPEWADRGRSESGDALEGALDSLEKSSKVGFFNLDDMAAQSERFEKMR